MKETNICKFVTPQQIEGLTVSCFVLETNPEIMNTKKILSAHKMILIIKGEGTFLFDGMKLPFSSNNLIFGFENESFYAEDVNDCEYMYISFQGKRADELLRRFNIHKNNRCFTGFDGLLPLWKESLLRADTQTADLATESMLYYTFSRLSSAVTPQDSLFHKLIEIIEKQFNDPDLSLNSIAQDLSYNQKYLSHLFKMKMGMGFSEYLRTTRIKYAISLLDHGIDSVKNVAFLSGYTDPLYFSTVFKKETGVSPKEYMQNKK